MNSILFLIPGAIIVLMFLPIILELKISYNFLNNTGVISVYLYKKNLIYYIFEFDGKHISIKEREESEEKKIDFNDPVFIFYKKLVMEVLNKLRIRYIDIYYNIGANDAFLTSMICGYINTICLMLFSFIKNQKPTASLGIYDTASYNKSDAVIAFNTNVSISLFDLVYSLFLSVILSLKVKNKTAT